MNVLLTLLNFIILQTRYRYYEFDEKETVGIAIGFLIFYIILFIVLILLYIVPMWKIFVKAGKPGWAAIIPIYNTIVILEIVGRPIWWIILFLIPCVNLVISVIVCIDLAKSFGKDPAFGVGLFLLPVIFYPILGFGSAQYTGPSVTQSTPSGV
ncbi:MAG: DUF5684 domain-containing protein [Ignavibacteria bacterium]|nr:DUF5684 domain-containing protein [Ignavibacteria bacterium]